jgi:putative membrane protein
MAKDKILVISVDRDNDIGVKTPFKGPIIGRDKVLRSATALGLSDPEDSDFNAIFQAVRVYDEAKTQYEAEVAVLTGDKDVGLKSDKKIAEQFDSILSRFRATGVIFISDGSEDEYVMPIIQSKVPIISVKRVIVKQSEQLESGYYKIKDFISESMDNPKFAGIVFGLPAIVLILFGVFGLEGFRVVMGIFGIYLLIKGFRLEKYFVAAGEDVQTALSKRRFVFFLYVVAMVFFTLATYRGYEAILEWLNIGIFETVAGFFISSIFFYYIAVSLAWIGRSIMKARKTKKVASVMVFGLAISVVVYSAADLIIRPEISALNFLTSIIIGFAILFVALLMEWKF